MHGWGFDDISNTLMKRLWGYLQSNLMKWRPNHMPQFVPIGMAQDKSVTGARILDRSDVGLFSEDPRFQVEPTQGERVAGKGNSGS
jgi:hypothetical protein